MLLISVYIVFINRFMAHFGTEYVASFGIVSRLESVSIMPTVAVSMALITLVGMFYGAKRYDLLRNTIFFAVKIGVLFTCSVGLIFFLLPSLFLRIFTPDTNLLSIATPYLRIDVFTFPLMAISSMASRAMQGMGYGLPGFVINVIRIMIVAVPLAALFVFVLGYGYLLVAVAMVLGGIASNVVALTWLKVKFRKLGI